MALTLYYHPLSSYCHKVLFALYENNIEFKPALVNFQDKEASAEFFRLWPIGKIPVLVDSDRDEVLAETTIMLEHLDQNYPGPLKLFPKDSKQCLQARFWDRTLDLYLHIQMQKVSFDRMRPEDARDPAGVQDAKVLMGKTYDLLERQLEGRRWMMGDEISIADCAALPALFYGGIIIPFEKTHKKLSAYFERLYARPSVQRLMNDAKPYFSWIPYFNEMPERFK